MFRTPQAVIPLAPGAITKGSASENAGGGLMRILFELIFCRRRFLCSDGLCVYRHQIAIVNGRSEIPFLHYRYLPFRCEQKTRRICGAFCRMLRVLPMKETPETKPKETP